MRSIKHTIKCPLLGFQDLELTYELGLRDAQLERLRDEGDMCPGLLDMPNWDDVASLVELCELDEAGELTDRPLPKPTFPLSDAAISQFPTVLQMRLLGNGAIHDAASDYIRKYRPN